MTGIAVRGWSVSIALIVALIHVVSSDHAAGQTLVGTLSGGDPQDLVVVGTTAYVVDVEHVLRLVDVSDPSSPRLLGSLGRTGTENGVGVAVAGEVVYVAAESDGLLIVDTSDPANPTLVGAITIPGSYIKGVVLRDTLAFLADQDFGLRILDISSPTAPTLVSSFATVDAAFDVAVEGSYAYIADNDFGLMVIDISDPANPVKAGEYEVQSTRGVAVRAGIVYLGDSSLSDDAVGMRVLDLQDPSSPRLLGQLETAGDVGRLKLVGSIAYITSWPHVDAVSIADPSAPRHIMTYETPGFACGLAADASYLYVADCDAVRIYTAATADSRETIPGASSDFFLTGLAPNPTSQSIEITYEIVRPGRVAVEIIDILGRHVTTIIDDYHTPGTYHRKWTLADVAAGTFIARLVTAQGSKSRTFVVL